ncbi:MAG: hypothetical protein K6U89_13190 [Chloroflexi bacterium]|nr:hypothetical protein [Chloroflexota bacterium]
MLLVRRWTAAVRLAWVGSTALALVLCLPGWPGGELRLPWVPGRADVALALVLRADTFARFFAGTATLIALAVALNDLAGPLAWRLVLGRQLALALGLLAILAGDLTLAASALLLLPVALGLSRRFDEESHLPALGALLLAGLALLAASAFGVAQPVGIGLLLAGLSVFLVQVPVHGLGRTLLGRPRGEGAFLLAALVLPGLALTFRFALTVVDPWRLQAVAALGAATLAVAGVRVARAREWPELLATLISLQAGLVLVALGQGISPTQPAAVLTGVGGALALAGISLLAAGVSETSGTPSLEGMSGLAHVAPGMAMVLLLGWLAISALPGPGGAVVGTAITLASAFSDGRMALVALVLVGVSGVAVAGGRLLALALAEAPARSRLRARPLGVVSAGLVVGASLLVGGLAFTAIDPAGRSAVDLFGMRPRPTGGELVRLPLLAVLASGAAMLASGVLGGTLGFLAERRVLTALLRRATPPQVEAGLMRWEASYLETERSPARGQRLATGGRFVLWTVAQALAVLEGRYYMATVLVLALWVVIIALG